jgi:hexokinase
MFKHNAKDLSAFAFYYGFHYDICKTDVLIWEIKREMALGLQGEASSMAMLPTYLNPVTRVPAGKKVLALDAGGTNLRAAAVRFNTEGKAETGPILKAPMPGTRGRVGKEAFFDEIAASAAPILEEHPDIEGIGFCFSYPTQMTADGDGILLTFSKEVDAPEVIGQAVGKGLREALFRRGVRYSGKIAVLNDTASTLLCGIMSIPETAGIEGGNARGVSGAPVIGIILGTGFNTAYPERDIPKIDFHNRDNPQIVVTESGNFDFRQRGRLDIEYDATTKNPNLYTAEKVMAGAYLGPLSLHILKRAVTDGVLRFRKRDELLHWPTLETKDLNAFMRAPLTKDGKIAALFDDDEMDALSSFVRLVSIITRRGGFVAAAILAATVEHIVERGGVPYPFTPVRIAVEGTTFLIYKGMREALESYLYAMLGQTSAIPYIITPVESASLNGAAVAALCA